MDFSRLNRREIWMKTPNTASNLVPFCLVDGKTAARGKQLRRLVSDAQLFCSRGWDRNRVDRRFFWITIFQRFPQMPPSWISSFIPLHLSSVRYPFLFRQFSWCDQRELEDFSVPFFNFHIFFEELSILWTKSIFLGENFFLFNFTRVCVFQFFLMSLFPLFSRVAPEIHDGSAASFFSWPTCCYYDYHHFYCY